MISRLTSYKGYYTFKKLQYLFILIVKKEYRGEWGGAGGRGERAKAGGGTCSNSIMVVDTLSISSTIRVTVSANISCFVLRASTNSSIIFCFTPLPRSFAEVVYVKYQIIKNNKYMKIRGKRDITGPPGLRIVEVLLIKYNNEKKCFARGTKALILLSTFSFLSLAENNN